MAYYAEYKFSVLDKLLFSRLGLHLIQYKKESWRRRRRIHTKYKDIQSKSLRVYKMHMKHEIIINWKKNKLLVQTPTKILWSNCTVVGFSVKFLSVGEKARRSLGIQRSANLGKELYTSPASKPATNAPGEDKNKLGLISLVYILYQYMTRRWYTVTLHQ